jgi:hypothetical protein
MEYAMIKENIIFGWLFQSWLFHKFISGISGVHVCHSKLYIKQEKNVNFNKTIMIPEHELFSAGWHPLLTFIYCDP